MLFFEESSFFELYQKYQHKSILSFKDKPYAVKKESFPSLIEFAPSGSWTSFNLNSKNAINLLERNIKESTRVIFTDINNTLNETKLKNNKYLKYFNKQLWFESDINLNVETFEQIKSKYKRRVKRNLKKCEEFEKLGELTFIQDNSRVNDFIRLHELHATEKGYAPYSNSFITDMLKMEAKLFFIIYKKEIIGSHIMLFDESIAFQYIHALNETAYHLRADDFFRNKLIEYAFNQGKKIVKFGGTPAGMTSLLEYKLGFGCTIQNYSIYTFYNSFITKIFFQLKSKFIK